MSCRLEVNKKKHTKGSYNSATPQASSHVTCMKNTVPLPFLPHTATSLVGRSSPQLPLFWGLVRLVIYPQMATHLKATGHQQWSSRHSNLFIRLFEEAIKQDIIKYIRAWRLHAHLTSLHLKTPNATFTGEMTDKQHTFQNYKSSMAIWQSVNWATPARQISDQVENIHKSIIEQTAQLRNWWMPENIWVPEILHLHVYTLHQELNKFSITVGAKLHKSCNPRLHIGAS